MKHQYILIFITLSFLFYSCKKESHESPDNELMAGGILVVNEGNYSSANASITYYDPKEDSIINDVFYRANNVPLGDVAQNICIFKDLAFITINNSGIVYGVNKFDMKFEGIISGLISPRKTLIINEQKAYVSDFSSKNITIFNPYTFEITGSINIGTTTEDLIMYENKVFVSNWSGYNQTKTNNMVFVIDVLKDEVIDSITVGLEPQSMVIDVNSNIWVLCSGGYDYVENPTLWCLSTTDYSVIKKLEFPEKEISPENLIINKTGDKLFFINKDIYSMPISSSQLPSTPFITSDNNTFYTIAITGESEVYASDVKDYVHNGEIYRYNSTGNLITSFEAGFIPGSIVEIE